MRRPSFFSAHTHASINSKRTHIHTWIHRPPVGVGRLQEKEEEATGGGGIHPSSHPSMFCKHDASSRFLNRPAQDVEPS